mmetsp:Transcript_25358/g.37923  ORF Transcript_25358/g.37923 Transcript_25358/m.37923 type:complete len:133 (-) Transcript_25358:315-713(-)
MLTSRVRNAAFLLLLATILQQFTVKGCECFEASELLVFTESNTDFEHSCRHNPVHGVGLFMSYDASDFDEEGYPTHEPYAYYVSLKPNMPECTVIDHESTIPLGDLRDAEACVQLIADHCVKISPNLAVLEY